MIASSSNLRHNKGSSFAAEAAIEVFTITLARGPYKVLFSARPPEPMFFNEVLLFSSFLISKMRSQEGFRPVQHN